MPRARTNAAAGTSAEPEEPVESEKVELDETDEETGEDVEYEEVEEEIEEFEEIEEEVTDEETSEEDEDTTTDNNGADRGAMQVDDVIDEDESEKHAELLALPPHGSEVYIGGIPCDASKEDLKTFCETVGQVVEVRMMKNRDSTENKCYAFVIFSTKELATKAISDLNNTQLKGKKIKCSASQVKHRLFIGNVPRNWLAEEMEKAVSKVGPGVTGVQLMKDQQNSSRNRGYAFIEYYNHACAEYSRKKMSTPKFKLDDNSPTVSWADPKNGDSASTSQIKSVYVKNLPKNVTQDELKKLFKHHGEITKIVLPPARSGQENRIGFVHFAERSSAMRALKNTEEYELDGRVLVCSLAKPPAADKKVDTVSQAKKGPLLPSNAPSLGYGMLGGAYSALPSGYGQPMVYGRAPPAGVAMVPMILPDGRLAYVLQQPGPAATAAQHIGGRGGNSIGSWQGNDSSRGRRFQPY